MSFAGINHLAVIIAALAAFAAWVGVVHGAVEALAARHGQDRGRAQEGGAGQGITVRRLPAGAFRHGVDAGRVDGPYRQYHGQGRHDHGAFVWTGFVITTMGVNHTFGGQKPMLTLIDGLYWLAVLVLMGAVIGAFGV